MKKTILAAIFALATVFTAAAQSRITSDNFHKVLPISAMGDIDDDDVNNVESVSHLNMSFIIEQNESDIILTIISNGERKEPTLFSRKTFHLFETKNGDILLMLDKEVSIAFMNLSFGWVLLYND